MPRSYIVVRLIALAVSLAITGVVYLSYGGFGGSALQSAAIIKLGLVAVGLVVLGGVTLARRSMGR
jgi:hypothetical protein